jgi:hypothetical protein
MQQEDPKMNRKAIAFLLVAMLAITITGLKVATALPHDISGEDPSWWDYQSSGGTEYPCYCECYHSVWPGDSENTEVGLGVAAYYFYGEYLFDEAWWYFDAQFGNGSVHLGTQYDQNRITIDPCVNGDDHHLYAYYGDPSWETLSVMGWTYDTYWLPYEIGPTSIGLKTSVEGEVSAYFYTTSNPGQPWWQTAYTQNPPGQSGNGWSFLTAWG